MKVTREEREKKKRKIGFTRESKREREREREIATPEKECPYVCRLSLDIRLFP